VGEAREPTSGEVLAQLERILASDDFDTSERSREFLRFVVEETLRGHADAVNQHQIATSVFGRRDDFDPTTDPIVRMQAGRVRRALEHYYLTAGRDDPLVIEIPKGSYIPQFRREVTTHARPTLLVETFSNATEDPSVDFMAQGLASDLAIELDRYRHFDVSLGQPQEPPRASHPRFSVSGTLATVEDALKISLRLVDADTGHQLWGEQFRHDRAGPELGTFLDELASRLAATLADERGVLPRYISRESIRRPGEPGTYEAILRYYHFDLAPSLETFQEAITALRQAVEREAEYGLAWAHLARLYATNYSLELVEEETPIENALSFAETASRLEPLDRRICATKAFVHLIRGDIEEGRLEVDHALALNPDSLFFLDAVGYLLTLLGDWERGPELSRRAVRLNPYHRDVAHAGLWLDALRREDYETALHASQAFAQPGHFWSPLMRAVALAYLDRLDEASPLVESILGLKPNFGERGRWLIERYVKFDDLVARIERGLAKLDLDLA
jgi:adenylate cyclase